MEPGTDPPACVVSVPCPRCPGSSRTDCPRCGGEGILLLRVRPEHAALDAPTLLTLYPRPHRP